MSGILINAVWIIVKKKGICIFHQRFHGTGINPDLFTGFLSGIYTFSEEVTQTGGIEVMELKDKRLLYGIISNLVFIFDVTKDEDVDDVRKKITEISKVFIDKFGHHLVHWIGETSVFEPFKRDLSLIIEKMRPVNFVEVAFKTPQKKRLKLSEGEFKILSLCDGKTPVEIIASKTNISEFKVIRILNKLEKKKVITRKMIMRI